MIPLICGYKTVIQMNELYKIEIDSQMLKTNLWLPEGNCVWGEINYEFGVNIYKLPCIK